VIGPLLSTFLGLGVTTSEENEGARKPLETWPSWRGSSGTGAAADADPPITWSEDHNVRWKAAISGLGMSTPVVWGDRIFLTTAVPVGEAFAPLPETAPGAHNNLRVTHAHEFVVLAIHRKDGALLWKRTVQRGIPHEGGHETGSYASASPVTDGKHVWAFFGSRGLFCLDGEGEVQWQLDPGDMQSKHGHGEGASPALHGNTLVVNWDHEGQSFVQALDARSGEQLWRQLRDEVTSWTSPLIVEVDGKVQVVLSGTKRIRGYDLESGTVLWECGGLSQNVVAMPVFEDGVLYAGSSYEKRALLALRIDGARGDLGDSERLLWMRRRRTPYVPSPLLYDGWLYFLNHYQGILCRVRAEDGAEPAGPFRLQELGNIYASPVAAAGRIYIADLEGSTLVLKHQSVPEPLAVNRLNDRFSASPVLVGKELLLRGDRWLYCLAEEDSE
jgi:hypothetical protein